MRWNPLYKCDDRNRLQRVKCAIKYSISNQFRCLDVFYIFRNSQFHYLWDLFTLFKRAYSLLGQTVLKNKSISC
jgi:hypothetical protein